MFSNPGAQQRRRYLALWFPFFPAERQKRYCGVQDEPLVLAGKAGNALHLTAVSRLAAGLGITPGIALADARASFPQLNVVDADREGDAALLRKLAAWADRFTPLVALSGQDGLLLDITGCAGLFGGEASLRRMAMQSLTQFGFSTRASIAGTPDAAEALARFGRVAIVPEGKDAAATANLPIMALNAGEDAMRALRRAGLRQIGDLAARAPAAFTARFGRGLVTRLGRICGHEDRRLTPLRPPPPCRADRRFAEPLASAAALEEVLGGLLDEAAAELERRGLGGQTFEVSFFRSDGDIRRIGVATGRPSRDVIFIRKLFAERMGTLADPIDPGFGFDAMRLSVIHTAPLGAAQADFVKPPDETALADLIARLSVRFGQARVQGFAPEDTHMPERAARRVDALTIKKTPWTPPERYEPPLRPLHMFDPPRPITVMAGLPDDPPRFFIWRRRQHMLAAIEGPERIAPEWWRQNEETLTRDYYRVEDREGRRFWIYRRGINDRETPNADWFLHGLFA
ncbi:MAG: DNA polymerase Y family protein [Micropepsaceae bacterium]